MAASSKYDDKSFQRRNVSASRHTYSYDKYSSSTALRVEFVSEV